MTNLPPSCAVVMKSGNLNLPETLGHSRPVKELLCLFTFCISDVTKPEAKLHTKVSVAVPSNKDLFSCYDHAALCSTKIRLEGLLPHRIIVPSRFRLSAIGLQQFTGNVKVVRRGWNFRTKFEEKGK
jgi:hypothetical protein